MKSVADDLRREQQEAFEKLSFDERLEHVFRLGDWCTELFASANGLSFGEARRRMALKDQSGRRHSRCAVDRLNVPSSADR